MTRKYFGTDGIRGRANASVLTPEIAMKAGMAAGRIFTRGAHRHRVVIGKRYALVPGYMIENALVSGFTPPWAWMCSSSARCRRLSPC